MVHPHGGLVGGAAQKEDGQKAAVGQRGKMRTAIDSGKDKNLPKARATSPTGGQRNREAPETGSWPKKSTPAAPDCGPAEKNTVEMEFAGIAKQSTRGKNPRALNTAAKCGRSTDHSSVFLEKVDTLVSEESWVEERGDQTGMTVRPVRLSRRLTANTTRWTAGLREPETKYLALASKEVGQKRKRVPAAARATPSESKSLYSPRSSVRQPEAA